ncbi:MAG: LysM peptidoglycan-binding domain-containing protein [Thermaurantimonas sp.]
MPISTDRLNTGEKITAIRSKFVCSIWLVIFFVTSLSAQDLLGWLELRYSFALPEGQPPDYGALTSLVREVIPEARQVRNEHTAQFLRKHSVRQVYGISLFKSLYRDISDSALALAALLTGFNEVYLDKFDQAGAGRLSVFQAMKCGLRIDALIDERFALPENLMCLQFWMRAYPDYLNRLFYETSQAYQVSDMEYRQLFARLLSYFSQIPRTEIPMVGKTLRHQHPYAVSIAQWIALRSDLKTAEALNTVLRTDVIPPDYPVWISKETKVLNAPVAYSKLNRRLEKDYSLSAEVRHVVKRGETLTQISKKYGVTIESIQRANSLRDDKIFEGQVLVIPRRP